MELTPPSPIFLHPNSYAPVFQGGGHSLGRPSLDPSWISTKMAHIFSIPHHVPSTFKLCMMVPDGFFSVCPANGSSTGSFTPTTIHQMKMEADLQSNTTRRLINETHGSICSKYYYSFFLLSCQISCKLQLRTIILSTFLL